MKTEVEQLPEGRVALSVEVDPPAVEEALDQAYRRLVHTVVLPGFRRGRAPRSVVERMLGRARLWRDAVDPLVQRSFDQAAADRGLEPVESPQVEYDTIPGAGDPFAFKAVFTVKPEVGLGDYRAIRIPRQVAPVADADVDQALQELQARRARWLPEEKEAAADGMMVTVDVTGTVADAPVPAENGVSGVLGEGSLRAPIEEALRGMRPGEAREVELSFPDDDADAGLAGKSGTFTVALTELKRKQLPELDDAFAREVSESAATLEELRAEVQNTLARVAAVRADDAVGTAAAERAVDEATVQVPSVMVERQIDRAIRDLERQLEQGGGSLLAYLEQQGRQLEDLRAEMRGDAERQVKTQLVLDAIAEREGLAPSQDEVRREIEDMASRYGPSAGQVRRLLQRPDNAADVRAELRLAKAARFVRDLALGEGDAADAGGASATSPATVADAGGASATSPATASDADDASATSPATGADAGGAAATPPATGAAEAATGADAAASDAAASDAAASDAAASDAAASADEGAASRPQRAEGRSAGSGGRRRGRAAGVTDPEGRTAAAEQPAAAAKGSRGGSRGGKNAGARSRAATPRPGAGPDPQLEAEAGGGSQPEDRAEAKA